MKRSRSILAAALFATVLPWQLTAAPEPQAAAGRALVSRYADAIVSVELVVTLKMKMAGRGVMAK